MELGAPVTLQVTPPLTAMAPPGLDAPAVATAQAAGAAGRRWKASSAAYAFRHCGARRREARRSMVVAFPVAGDLLPSCGRQLRPPLLLPETTPFLLPLATS
ncbi:hypothetical protein QYE76_049570 [Lolium multiflorum]|uniref:Uncharacterized protein n=1 Tax=Lolium multiflorum TaxID=4521 RepID=A0AAD8SNB5_LOLMU|nr:hypothetical protein QYE76_049570 [Lolium multiflorum]